MNSSAALLAFPSRAGAFKRSTTSSSRQPLNSVFRAFGITRTLRFISTANQTGPFRCGPSWRLLQLRLRNRGSCPSRDQADRNARRVRGVFGSTALHPPDYRTAAESPLSLEAADGPDAGHTRPA